MGAYYDGRNNKPKNMVFAMIRIGNIIKYLGAYTNDKDAACAFAFAKRSLTQLPEQKEFTELLACTTDGDKRENLQTLRSRDMSDVPVRTYIPFYYDYYDHHHYYDILLYLCAYITLSTAHCPNLLK
jgi:hypothetical protein